MNTVFELLKELKQDIQHLKDKGVAAKTESVVPVKKTLADFLADRCSTEQIHVKNDFYGLFVHKKALFTYSGGFSSLPNLLERLEKDKKIYENVPAMDFIKILAGCSSTPNPIHLYQ